MRIGILGGSFNPAHEGHLHISRLALKDMGLDQIWWMVSPGNPLKSLLGMASFETRFAGAGNIAAQEPRIIVTDIEVQLGTRFTADTLKRLHMRFAQTHFVWIMGADNLLQIPRWQRWREIFETCDVAVYRRPPYAVGCFRGMAAVRFARSRLPARKARVLARGKRKHWVLFSNRLNAQSATNIRAQNASVGFFLG